MAYLLLAVGALMSLAGAYLAVTGYHIVQIEEGWSSVIAGSTLFVGGFLLVGLGLVLRALSRLQAVLAGEGSAVAALKPPPSAAAPAMGVSDKIEPAIETGLRPERPILPPRIPIAPVPPVADEATPLLLSDHDQSAGDTLGPPARGVPEDTHGHARDEDASGEDHYELETPSTPEHDLVAPAPTSPPPLKPSFQPAVVAVAPPTIPAPKPSAAEPALSDDWLDKAFAEFDQGLPQKTPGSVLAPPAIKPFETRPTPVPAQPSAPEPTQELIEASAQHDGAAEPEPPLGPAVTPPAPTRAPVEPAPRPAGPSSTVIGRYESDGTVYVMYADGSIEAQSEAGLFRFASMADLKASFDA